MKLHRRPKERHLGYR